MEKGWDVNFRRMLGQEEKQEWDELANRLQVLCSGLRDVIEWALSKDRKFTTNSLYRSLLSGVSNRLAINIWQCKIPFKFF
jgi:hypothetical protein